MHARPAGQCEKDAAEQSQAQPSLRLHWDRGGPGATGGGMHWAEASRLHRLSASLKTEARGTRKSSEVAHGVFSRVREFFFSFFFFFRFLEVLHI